jgi:hypothetical protein
MWISNLLLPEGPCNIKCVKNCYISDIHDRYIRKKPLVFLAAFQKNVDSKTAFDWIGFGFFWIIGSVISFGLDISKVYLRIRI